MLIDKNGKLFGKVSIVDILIIVMILGVVAGVGYKFSKSSTATPFAKKDTIVTTFYQETTPDFVPGSIKVGDMVTDNATGSVFGKVISVKADKDVSFAANVNGEMVQSSKPGYNSVIITVEGEGVFKDGNGQQGVSFNNTDFYINKSIELKAGKVDLWVKIKNLEKKG